jgi:threonine aldolase
MLKVMFAADVGDDVYADDPTANKLEETVAHLLGFEAGLYTPSGTMANQIAINLHTKRGDTVLAEQDSHVYLFEAGAAAALSGVQFDQISHHDRITSESLAQSFKSDHLHSAPTTLLVVENTHNRASGRVTTKKELAPVVETAKSLGLNLHCDGARLWNAAIALNCKPKELLHGFDSVSVCFSKGLGAPVGSVLCGKKSWIETARKTRKRWGGGMRQIGYLAAACLYALENHLERLADDHTKARTLKLFLEELHTDKRYQETLIDVKAPDPITNMVYLQVRPEFGDELIQRLKNKGILTNHIGHGAVRFVTHLDISDADMHVTKDALSTALLH